jgi:hypothetical protein
MAGPVPAIHALLCGKKQKEDVDARDEPGHNELIGSETERRYSVTGFSEICQSLPSNVEMCSVFIGE